jgi:hypothetical protein
LIEPDLIHSQFLGNLVRVISSELRTAYVHPPQRLAELHARGAAGLSTELNNPAYFRNLGEETLIRLAHLGPAGQKDTLWRTLAGIGH